MIHPEHIPAGVFPPVVAVPGLLNRTTHWGFSQGFLAPRVFLDATVGSHLGNEGLLLHEALHCMERHTFWKVCVGSLTFLVGVVLLIAGFAHGGEQRVAFLSAAVGSWLGGAGYLVWWLREAEIRADAFALEGVGTAGMVSFLLLVGQPAVMDGPPAGPMAFAKRIGLRVYRRWLRWLYARTIHERLARAARMRKRLGWPLPPKPDAQSSASGSCDAPKAPTSKSEATVASPLPGS